MFVKSLTLKGFKSFAESATLDLRPGVNVVVGPNGSGKSNVIDAVAWVLGAQGARALRGGKMEDVIFAGTGKKSALGRAEVSLTIDNSDGRLPLDFTEITLTRTLFRSGESEYAINGVACRLLDIQELLSDSGVGRQQHVIVSQGNLDAVLSARPEERRAIIEEAAGVLKFRKRRERSQRRLIGTESNLERLADLVREVRQQLRPLEKQANAARRHEEVASEVTALRLFNTGRDIAVLREREQTERLGLAEFETKHGQLRAQIDEATEQVASADAELNALPSDDSSEIVERLERLHARVVGTRDILTERKRSLQRDLDSAVSADVVAQLDSDIAAVKRELDEVEASRQDLIAPRDAAGREDEDLKVAWAEFEEQWGEGLPVTSNEAAQVRGQLSSIDKNMLALKRELESRTARLEDLREQLQSFRQQADQSERAHNEAQDRQDVLRSNAQEAREAHDAARSEHEDALEKWRAAEHRVSVTTARAETLASALDATRAQAGVARLEELDGVKGTLLDLVEIDDGYEAAFESAVGEALGAVVVESPDVARVALERLGKDDIGGAVIALSNVGEDISHIDDATLAPLRKRVRGTSPQTNGLLDRLLCCAVVAEEDEAIETALAFPDLVVVTRSGNRFARSGWRTGRHTSGVTAVAVEEANEARDLASKQLQALAEALDEKKATLSNAAACEREAEDSLRENEQRLGEASRTQQSAQTRIESLGHEIEGAEESIGEVQRRISGEETEAGQLRLRLPDLEAGEATGAEQARLWREARALLETRSHDLRRERARIEVAENSLDERSGFLSRRAEALQTRADQYRVEIAEAEVRRTRIEGALSVLNQMSQRMLQREAEVSRLLTETRSQRDEHRAAMSELTRKGDQARRFKSQAETALMELSEARQSHELRLAEIGVRIEAVVEILENELQVSEAQATAAPQPELPDGVTPKARLAALEKELKAMGPINPLALAEFEEVKERHDFLEAQLSDVQESRKELMRVIRAVDTEIKDSFISAYEDVAANFNKLFGVLFPGGSGNLKLTDPDDPLETGIEIEARPSGKNVRTLSLLSGGERSLAAMAFLFAVFRSRPSPFYLLDEVEAPLDDINLDRFLSLVEEFRAEAQLVIVSHQKRTMEVADCLYGVSMQTGGSSKVVSQRLDTIDLRDRETQPA